LGLNFSYCPGRMRFKFIIPFNAFPTIRCTEAGNT